MVNEQQGTGFQADIIADSQCLQTNTRLTTFVLTFPRMILAEVNTHRMLSRNSASSRAIPYKRMVEKVLRHPFIPLKFQRDHKGMQGTEYFEGREHHARRGEWLMARNDAVNAANRLNASGVTKQLANRLLEPFMWHTAIVTATDWENFFALRAHEAAEIHFQKLAGMMLKKLNARRTLRACQPGDWHVPFGSRINEKRPDFLELVQTIRANEPVDEAEAHSRALLMVSVARCARVSYLNYEGGDDYMKDFALFERLATQGHMSPFEHVAQASEFGTYCGNFKGWQQLRKQMPDENRMDPRVTG